MLANIKIWYFAIAILIISIATSFFITSQPDEIDFNAEVRPILNERCVSCHGGVKRQGGLSLLFREEVLKKNDSGLPAIVPHYPQKSELIKRIKHHDLEERMPPEGPPLSKDEISILSKWIESGAKWESHWAFIPLDFETLASQQKKISDSNVIDHYIRQALEEKRLNPSPPASPKKLVRRLFLDLIGLPPSPSQVQSFLQNPSDTAYESMVDSLLSLPQFGEKWASMWLDLARYGDSQGYQKDRHREIWPYRDWVIKAFNKDMPFDSFTIHQLAGDLLPQVNKNKLIATAFHRNTMTNDEGGTDDEEFRVVSVIDRVNTTFEIWQGLTISCVQCHSHPYDPFKHEEFYEAYAFFNNTADRDLTNEYPTLKEAIPTSSEIANVPIMQELMGDNRRETFVFERGNWLVHGKKVHADVPETLNKWPKEKSRNRLGFANWLLHYENPLTARVLVNRFWAEIFGRGIVKTVEDFGTQGDKPSHPALLDHLAYNFIVTHNWHVKALLKQIVMSSTYQQSSKLSAKKLEIDPGNKWLSRGPRVRLSAEQIRDQALTSSGLLSSKMYGPPVMPSQPAGVWNTIRHLMKWVPSEGEDRYRRAVYTYLRRSSPYPAFTTFDSPSRELCVSRRIRTNTPLQALATMNDTVFVEAADALANKVLDHHSEAKVEDKIESMYTYILGYSPDQHKLDLLTDYYQESKLYYDEHPEEAKDLLYLSQKPSPELAAMHTVAQVIYNLDETITKE